jgi:hypothetical protein
MADNAYLDNPYMKAKTLDELKAMEKSLYTEVYQDGQLSPDMEEYYEHQMELFLDAFATLFPDDYDFHKRVRPK